MGVEGTLSGGSQWTKLTRADHQHGARSSRGRYEKGSNRLVMVAFGSQMEPRDQDARNIFSAQASRAHLTTNEEFRLALRSSLGAWFLDSP